METIIASITATVLSLVLIYIGIRSASNREVFKEHLAKKNKKNAQLDTISQKLKTQNPEDNVKKKSKSIRIHRLNTNIHIDRIDYESFDDLKITAGYRNKGIGTLRISRETTASHMKKAAFIDDITFDDKDFDTRLFIEASNYNMATLLNPELRSHILKLYNLLFNVYYQFEITERELVIQAPIKSFLHGDTINEAVNLVAAIVNNFKSAPDMKSRLCSLITTEPSAKMRLKYIKMFADNFSRGSGFEEALSQCLNDKDIGIQIETSSHLGKKGMKHLIELLTGDGTVSEKESLKILDILSENTHPIAIEDIQKLYKTSSSKVKTALLHHLKTTGSNDAAAFLLDLIDTENISLKTAAIDVLGKTGTADIVEKLYHIEKDSINPILKTSLKNAISDIQSRIEKGGRGWLSSNEHKKEEGGLSISGGTEEGALSRVDE